MVNSLHNAIILRNILISGQMQDAGQFYKMHWHWSLENNKICLQIISSNKSYQPLKKTYPTLDNEIFIHISGTCSWESPSLSKAICIKAFLS